MNDRNLTLRELIQKNVLLSEMESLLLGQTVLNLNNPVKLYDYYYGEIWEILNKDNFYKNLYPSDDASFKTLIMKDIIKIIIGDILFRNKKEENSNEQ